MVTSTTDFPEPVPSPPFLDGNTALATPSGRTGVPLTRILVIDEETELVTLSAEVRSEDLGRQLSARGFVDYQVDPSIRYSLVGGGETLPAGTFDTPRRISAFLRPKSLANGCYQISMLATHEWDGEELIPVLAEDSAILVWWMIKGDPALVPLTSCPGLSASTTTPEADAAL